MLICVVLDCRGVGIDCVSFDTGRSQEFGVHTTLFAQNVWGLENVANLGKVPATGATVMRYSTVTKNIPSKLLPLKKKGNGAFQVLCSDPRSLSEDCLGF